ncbi:MFS transporter [Pseudomonas sp. nanlin1]|uniref:MFS transporter n=1 Tax=Pseudomonas sp. nanlin1 TaxID=3040605 RepID=UPI00388D7EB9
MTAAAPSLLHSSLLGFAQIIAWGGSFYLTAVLATAVVQDTGWGQPWVYGALSLGILTSGLLAPWVGRRIALHGGRQMLLASALVLPGGLLLLAAAPNLPWFVLSWLVIGAGMAAGLYDALFATLGTLYGQNARRAITQVTLVSGFCTSLVWPYIALLVEHLGWRGACVAYSATLLASVLPIYLFTLPRHVPAAVASDSPSEPPAAIPEGKVFWLLTASFTLAAIIFTSISVQLISLLQELGLSLVAALAVAALIGPSQVAARVLEVVVGRQAHPIWSTLGSALMVTLGLALTWFEPLYAAIGLIVYGTGSGLRSIVRGTLPLALFGSRLYPQVLGLIARPTLLAQAITPLLGGYLQSHFGASATFAVLIALAALNVLLVLWLSAAIAR